MATNYTVKITDHLLRFDTTADDAIVTMLPFADTPNAPYEIHKTSVGDGHTVTIQPDPTTPDFLLPDTSNVVLDDTNNTAIIRIPANGFSPAFVSMGGVSSGGGGGGGGPANVPAPNVTITGPAEIFFRSNNQVEVDIAWSPAASATAANFRGVQVYLEDPDISSGPNIPLDGSALLDGSRQASGQWAPVPVTEITESPAVLLLDSTSGGTAKIRNIRVYLAAYGPYSQPKLVRATESSPTPNIMVEVAQGPSSYQSGMEWAFNVTNPKVAITTDYNRPDPQYYLTFTYDPPDPATPLPPGVNQFGGCRIVYVQEDSSGNPIFPGTDQAISVPVAQSQTGYLSPAYSTAAGGTQFRAYFCSEDNASPLGSHINSLVEGVTPYVEVPVPLVAPAPDVTNFAISGQKILHLLNQTFVAEAVFSWALPSASAGGVRYAGVFLYLVKVTGTAPLTAFPAKLTGQQSNVDTGFTLDISNVPANPEVWTVAAISVDVNGHLSDTPANYGQPSFHSPTVTWNIGPPVPGSPGSGTEYAPLVTVNAGSAAVATQSISADGVGMVSFKVSSWTNPTSNQFGNAQVAMVVNSDPTKPTYWSVPVNATSFQTPPVPSFGNIGGAAVPVDFYIVSDDPQGHKNSLQQGTTPVISVAGGYVPQAGAIVPARSGWFDPTEFQWPPGLAFGALQFAAQKIFVGSILRVGGGAGTDAASFAGQQNGQIAVYNASNVLRAWIGEQQATQGDGSAIYGGWFGQLWVGGAGPLSAPLFIDNQGIIEVGGIAAAHGATYPYISVRDNTGLEAGRIGAMISSATDPTGNVGGSPPTLTSGAWFTQLAVGGSNLTNWNVLITPDLSNPLGSNFQMRNINLLSIDYAALSGNPARNEYKLEFGNSVWMGGGLPSGQWQFPGIHIYEVDNSGNNFGATFLNRGMVLRGTQTQGYPVLVSLSSWNGDQGGSDIPPQFFGVLAMASPLSPSTQNVVIASGSYGGGVTNGSAYMSLANASGTVQFSVAQTGVCTAVSYAVVAGGKAVIDSAGNWVGNAIAGSQTPWASDIAGANHNLTNVASIQVNGTTTTGALAIGSFGTAISASAQFTGSGGVSTTGSITGSQFSTNAFGLVINSAGQFLSAVNAPSFGVLCGSLTVQSGPGQINCNDIVQQGHSNHIYQHDATGILIDCASNGIWSGQGVQTTSSISAGFAGGGWGYAIQTSINPNHGYLGLGTPGAPSPSLWAA